jgi:lipopolysaccharide transport system permease protein
VNLKKNINLTREFIRSDFKLRYHGSYLGYFWSFLKPLLIFGVLLIVFTKFVRFKYEDYPLYLFLGIIMWNFLSEATVLSMNSVLQKGGLIKKIYFPRIIIVFSSTTLALITLFLNLIVFGIFYFFLKGTFSWTMPIFLLFVGILYIIVFGFSLALSALYTKFRDLLHMWEVFLQIGFWATPIIYPIQLIPEKYKFFVFLNPFADIIHNARLVVINHQLPETAQTLFAFSMGISIFALGYLIFLKRVSLFPEEI